MPELHFIRTMLDILDFNIVFQGEKEDELYTKEFINDETCHVFHATLSYNPDCCTKCGMENNQSIIKWGFKTVNTQLNKVSEYKTFLRLKKQRFKCKNCHQTFIAESTLTKPRCSISNRVKLKIASLLEDSVSMSFIAEQLHVSTMTVLRVLRDFYTPTLPQEVVLPKVLCFDEFKSGAFAEGAMSCILMDGKEVELMDILENRQKEKLKAYFQRYDLENRANVKYVVTDFYPAYITLSEEMFPNGNVLIDRFHIVQLIGKTFQNHRISIMKSFHKDQQEYSHLKKYWKLLQKKQNELNWQDRHWSASFRAYLTQTEIVDRLLAYNKELKQGYEVYQSFLHVIQYHQKTEKQQEAIEGFQDLLKQSYKHLPENYQTTIKTYKRYQKEILLALQLPYSNGPVEATNNHIKVLKRTAYGFRNFINFKTRIFINRRKSFENKKKKEKKAKIKEMNKKKRTKKSQATKAA